MLLADDIGSQSNNNNKQGSGGMMNQSTSSFSSKTFGGIGAFGN
jgi:hypothetical protein